MMVQQKTKAAMKHMRKTGALMSNGVTKQKPSTRFTAMQGDIPYEMRINHGSKGAEKQGQ